MNVFLDENLPVALCSHLVHPGVNVQVLKILMGGIPAVTDVEIMEFIGTKYCGQRNILLTRDREMTRRIQEVAEWRKRDICLVVLSGNLPQTRSAILFAFISSIWPGVIARLLADPAIHLVRITEKGIIKAR